ncbi:MAG: hypothetical protein PHU33_16380, partial [Bacteroidales bacterium]|nr:hypothetical protein [Bacteroidales bacterium]
DDFPFRKPSTPSVLETPKMLADFLKKVLQRRKNARLHKAAERTRKHKLSHSDMCIHLHSWNVPAVEQGFF